MEKVIIALGMIFTLNCQAQFYYYPFPPSKIDYKLIEKSGAKICYEYKVDVDTRVLTNVLEYGSLGLSVVLYEKGVNDNGDSATLNETTYKYNKLLSLESTTFKDFEENENSITSYTYDAKGKLITKTIASIDPPTYKYSYDAAGRIAKATVTVRMPAYDQNGEPTGKAFDRQMDKYHYKYDSKNRLTEEWHFFSDDGSSTTIPSYKKKWNYNNKNQIIATSLIDIDGEVIFTEQMKYNEKGLLSRIVTIKQDGEKEEYQYEYCTDCKQSWMQ